MTNLDGTWWDTNLDVELWDKEWVAVQLLAVSLRNSMVYASLSMVSSTIHQRRPEGNLMVDIGHGYTRLSNIPVSSRQCLLEF